MKAKVKVKVTSQDEMMLQVPTGNMLKRKGPDGTEYDVKETRPQAMRVVYLTPMPWEPGATEATVATAPGDGGVKLVVAPELGDEMKIGRVYDLVLIEAE